MEPEAWRKVLAALEAEAGPASRAWLASARPVDAGEGALALIVPNAFARDALRERCGGALERVALQAGYRRVEVRIAVLGGGAGPSFRDFRVTEGNQLAYAASSSLARRLRPELHPLVLHGPPGCGKSHLLSAIGAAARAGGVQPVLSTSVPRLASRISLAARDGRLPAFRTSFRRTRLLILDRAEALAGKVKTQVELVHALDTLGAGGGMAVLALREDPARMEGLHPTLQSRLQGGLVVLIDATI